MKDDYLKLERIEQYNEWAHVKTLHPLVSVFRYPQNSPVRAVRQYFGFYAVFLKIGVNGDIFYGTRRYEYNDGTLIFTGPGQVVDLRHRAPEYQPSGRVLLFHPELLHGTPLARMMREFTFFSYDVSEGLNLNDREREIINQLLDNIEEELHDTESVCRDKLIVANIALLLAYCRRFYERQFASRNKENNHLLSALEHLLDNYLSSDRPRKEGLPSVQFCADSLHLSSNYLSDLLRNETGLSALKYIHERIVDCAKMRLADPALSISEVAYSLGFEYPQHFTRLFRRETGYSPSEYRSQIERK